MKKRIWSLLLAGTMAAGLMAGSAGTCLADEQELTTIKILCKNDFSAEIKTADWEQYPVSQVFIQELEEIGIRLELECIDNESFANVVQTRMASGVDLPDLVAYCWVGNDDEGVVLDFGQNGLVYPINELLEQYDEDGSIRAFYDEKAPGVWEKCTAADGNVYWFSYLYGIPNKVDKATGTPYVKATPHAFCIRQDWLEKIGEEKKDAYTPEEVLDIVKKMQEADVNGNGVKDEIIYVPLDSFNYFAHAWGMTSGLLADYFMTDNQVFSNFQHENFNAYIEYMQALYENGLIDTAALTTSQEEMISQDRVAVAYGYTHSTFEDTLPGATDDGTYYVPFLIDADGDLTSGLVTEVDSVEGMTYCQYFAPSGSENAEAVVRLMDYIYTEEYSVMDYLGLEGKGYELDENGNYVELSSDGNESTSLFETSLGLYALPAMVNIVPSVEEQYPSGSPQHQVDKLEWNFKFYTEFYPMADKVQFAAPFLSTPTEEENAFLSENTTILETYASELIVDLTLGNKSLDDMPEYLEELEELGLSKYVEIMQARRSRIVGE